MVTFENLLPVESIAGLMRALIKLKLITNDLGVDTFSKSLNADVQSRLQEYVRDE